MAYTPDEIKTYLKDVHGITPGANVDDATASKILSDSRAYGIGHADVSSAMGWNPQQVSAWVANNSPAPNTRQPPGPPQVPMTPQTPRVPIPSATGSSTTTTPAASTGIPESQKLSNDGYKNPVAAPAPAPAPAAFDPNSFAESMREFTQSLVTSLRPQPVEIKMPEPWRPSWEDLNGISAEKRIPGLLTGETAKAAGRLALGDYNKRGLLNSSMAVEGANNAMIANAAEIAGGDATRFGGLLQTQINNDAAMARLGVQGQIAERQSGIDQGYKLDTLGVNMMGDALKFDAGNKRDDFVYGRNRGDLLTDRADARDYEGRLYARGRADQLDDRTHLEGRADAQREEATDTALQTAYATATATIKDGLNREIAAIQQSDLPPDVKQAQVAEAITRAKVNVQLTNSLFSNMPKWKAEWSQLTLEI